MQTPHRFRSKRQLWTYSGLGIETRDSAQYRWVDEQLQRTKKPQQIRGLNRSHNHDMKEIFKGAATRAGCGVGPLREFYVALRDKRMKPEMARLTLARKIAAIALTPEPATPDLVDSYSCLGFALASSTEHASSLSGCPLCRYSSAIRTGCANERTSGSEEGAVSNHDPYTDQQ